jgi:hypothetical protein
LYGGTPNARQYGNPAAMSYFIRGVQKCSWFTQIPVTHRISNGIASFGNEFSASVTRIGDYVINTWLTVTTPEVTLLNTNQFGVDGRLRWCRKFMHNLIDDCSLTFNDQQVARLDNVILDHHTQTTIEAGKQVLYDQMIGDIVELTGSHGPTTPLGATIKSQKLNLVLPFFYSLDSGLALPVSALLFNDIKINFKFRNWRDLLILDNAGAAGAGTVARATPVVGVTSDIASEPVLRDVSVWSTYILANDIERASIGEPRDVVIRQYQASSKMPFAPVINPAPVYEPKFTFSVAKLHFIVANTTFANERSNYTTASPYNSGDNVNYTPSNAYGPIKTITLNYDSQTRLSEMTADYFSQLTPFFSAISAPREIGYYVYSYALKQSSLDPTGSTNFSKIAAVQVQPKPSDAAVTAANGAGAAGSGADFAQKFEWQMLADSWTVIRYADGQLTFPFV